MNKLIDDLATLTTISQHALHKLNDKSVVCICHDVFESIQERNPLTEIDIGIGVLYIKCEENEVKYKFIPSKRLEESVLFTIQQKESPLAHVIEASLKSRIENTYKNLL